MEILGNLIKIFRSPLMLTKNRTRCLSMEKQLKIVKKLSSNYLLVYLQKKRTLLQMNQTKLENRLRHILFAHPILLDWPKWNCGKITSVKMTKIKIIRPKILNHLSNAQTNTVPHLMKNHYCGKIPTMGGILRNGVGVVNFPMVMRSKIGLLDFISFKLLIFISILKNETNLGR